MLFARNKQLSINVKNQGEKIIEQSNIIIELTKKLNYIQDVITINNYNNPDLQIRKIRKILNGGTTKC